MSSFERWIAAGTFAGLVAGALVVGGCSHSPRPDPTGTNPTPPPHAARTTHKAAPAQGSTAANPAAGVTAGSSTTAAPDSTKKASVVPALTPAQAKEMDLLSKNNVDSTQDLLARVDPAKLDADGKQKYQIAKGMLADAITARAQQDWMKAAQLSSKAKVLAEEISGP